MQIKNKSRDNDIEYFDLENFRQRVSEQRKKKKPGRRGMSLA